MVETYDLGGKLTSLTDRDGLVQTLNHTGDNLATVGDGFGRSYLGRLIHSACTTLLRALPRKAPGE